MTYLIFKPTRSEREERLRASRPQGYNVRGGVRTTEEAVEMQRIHEREGERFTRPYAVSGDSPEARQADAETKLRAGINPETNEPLYSPSTRHEGSK